ncbi:MAG: Type 1 glutamine amidotransferase-like domain-containing protein [Clostridia bacterium]|nr:Type 1 glutamine amidotransferase-like domain-containing protein [Clostridia bacterium]
MIHILLEGYDIQAPYLLDTLKQYIKPEHRVVVIAFSFRDMRVKNASDWERLYGRKTGHFYKGIAAGFSAYGLPEEQIMFLNYFTDTKESAKKKIETANIIYFLGGLPDRMMERINEFDLQDSLLNHNGIVMGYSAGAVIQLAEYHLSSDHDYPAFGYYQGLPYLDGFY